MRGGDICRSCHLDPRARALPIESDLERRWLGRCLRTLFQLSTRPGASFRVVEEPVAHRRVLAFLASLRLPLWALAVGWLAVDWLLSIGEPTPLSLPSVLAPQLGAQFVMVLRLWLLLLVPIGLPMLYFFGGVSAHLAMALTGGARRSIGASMRAFGLALALPLVIIGGLDVLVIAAGVSPELWLGLLALAGLIALVVLAVALARTHATSLPRGLLVALVPVALFLAVSAGRGLLEFSRLPFGDAPVLDSYAPYLIE